jgi:hypothetical protein
MVQVSVSTSVAIADGPTLPMGTVLEPESYTFTSVTLAPAGQTGDHEQVVLMPDKGQPVLLAVQARTDSGEPATVVFTAAAASGGTTPPPLSVTGALLVWGSDAVKAVLPGGLNTLSVGHSGNATVQVDTLACLGS